MPGKKKRPAGSSIVMPGAKKRRGVSVRIKEESGSNNGIKKSPKDAVRDRFVELLGQPRYKMGASNKKSRYSCKSSMNSRRRPNYK